MVTIGETKLTRQQIASPKFDLSDPIGMCRLNFAGIHLCNNESNNPSIIVKVIGAACIIFAVLIGDALDLFGWAIGWIPVVGDLIGSTVLGNILDAVAFVILFFWIGFPAFFGLGEFTDILGFIPGFGDILGFIDVLPWWTWAVAIWLIFQLLKSFNLLGGLGGGFKLFSAKKSRGVDTPGLENVDGNPFL